MRLNFVQHIAVAHFAVSRNNSQGFYGEFIKKRFYGTGNVLAVYRKNEYCGIVFVLFERRNIKKFVICAIGEIFGYASTLSRVGIIHYAIHDFKYSFIIAHSDTSFKQNPSEDLSSAKASSRDRALSRVANDISSALNGIMSLSML